MQVKLCKKPRIPIQAMEVGSTVSVSVDVALSLAVERLDSRISRQNSVKSSKPLSVGMTFLRRSPYSSICCAENQRLRRESSVSLRRGVDVQIDWSCKYSPIDLLGASYTIMKSTANLRRTAHARYH